MFLWTQKPGIICGPSQPHQGMGVLLSLPTLHHEDLTGDAMQTNSTCYLQFSPHLLILFMLIYSSLSAKVKYGRGATNAQQRHWYFQWRQSVFRWSLVPHVQRVHSFTESALSPCHECWHSHWGVHSLL